jgi:hypothetical protein
LPRVNRRDSELRRKLQNLLSAKTDEWWRFRNKRAKAVLDHGSERAFDIWIWAFYGYGYPEKLRCGLSGQRLLSNIGPF